MMSRWVVQKMCVQNWTCSHSVSSLIAHGTALSNSCSTSLVIFKFKVSIGECKALWGEPVMVGASYFVNGPLCGHCTAGYADSGYLLLRMVVLSDSTAAESGCWNDIFRFFLPAPLCIPHSVFTVKQPNLIHY